MNHFRLAVAVGLLSTNACHTVDTIQQDGFTVYKRDTERSFLEVRNRAAFEFSCPKDQIGLSVINVAATQSAYTYITQIGATACGSKAIYIRMHRGDWAMNTESVRSARRPQSDDAK